MGYYSHNIHFFVASASLEGRRADALAAQNRLREAEAERAIVEAATNDQAFRTLPISSTNMAGSIVAIGNEVLSGEIAVQRKNALEATRRFARAVALEDGLIYTEPPD